MVAVEPALAVDPVEGLELVEVEQQMHQVHLAVDYPSVGDLSARQVADLLVADLLVHHLVLLLGDHLHQRVEVHLKEAFLGQILGVRQVVVLLLVDL